MILKSTSNSNCENRSRVMMSPPAAGFRATRGRDAEHAGFDLPTFRGKFFRLGARQPVVVLPSQSKRQPRPFLGGQRCCRRVRSVSFRFRQRTLGASFLSASCAMP